MTNAAMRAVLTPLYKCSNYDGFCRDHCRWEPEHGLVPCGFGGATGPLDAVRLVLVTAEPGDPRDQVIFTGDPENMASQAIAIFDDAMERRRLGRAGRETPFHRNTRRLLDLCWPNSSLAEQLARTWTTNAVLCPAPVSGGEHPVTVELICARTHLAKQLSLLPNAFVMALGNKAQRRMRQAGLRFDACAQHPTARPNTNPEASWKNAAKTFRDWLKGSGESASRRAARELFDYGDERELNETKALQPVAQTLQRACAAALRASAADPGYRLRNSFAPGCSYQPMGARTHALELAHALHDKTPRGIISEAQLLRAFEVLRPLLHQAGNKATARRWVNFVLHEDAKGGAWYRQAMALL